MTELPDVLARGDRARLFPVLADTSKEGRTLSIFLSCFELVPELGRALLTSLEIRAGARAQIETYTEVVLKKGDQASAFRPDGLIILKSGGNTWSALVEAKVGTSELTKEQVEAYLDLARLNGIDALITLSNQFASLPTHHPVSVSLSARKRVDLFHWSWMYVVTQSILLLSDEEVEDREQRLLLREMNRFLLHASSGVRGFDQMPASWGEVAARVHAGGNVSPSSQEAREIVGAWHQEVGDLSLVLSRQLETTVKVRMPRAHAADPLERQKADQRILSEDAQLTTELAVPDTVDTIKVCVSLRSRSITLSMWLKSPDEPKGAKARLNWLLRQLQKTDPAGVYIRCFWPGKTKFTQHTLSALREDPELIVAGHEGQSLVSFEVLMVKDLANRLAQRKLFLTELEAMAPKYYFEVAQHLKPYQAKAPRLTQEKVLPEQVAPEALREEAEAEALAGEV
jgi:hypothetical protein